MHWIVRHLQYERNNVKKVHVHVLRCLTSKWGLFDGLVNPGLLLKRASNLRLAWPPLVEPVTWFNSWKSYSRDWN